MPDAEGAPRLPRLFVASLVLLATVFFGLGLVRANRSTLRGDEIMTLFQFWRVQPLGRMIVRGCAPQVSPAPLLYIVDTIADRSRARLNYLGLTPPGYVRLPSLLFTTGLGFAAALVVALRIRKQDGGGTPIQFLLILCGLAIFYFHPKVFAFAGTERPYGLWNGLWLFLLAWLLGRPPLPRLPLILLCLLAATATAACFQILAIGIALVIVRRIEGRPVKDLLKEGLPLLALPTLIGANYALRSVDMTYDDRLVAEKVPHFLRFWLLSNLHVWIAGGALSALALTRPKLREFAIPPVALTALIIVMPLIFTLTHMRGYSMVSRQYIWTSTAVPLAIFFTAAAWPELRPTRYLRGLAIVAALAIAAGNLYATFSRPPLRNDSRELALLSKDSPLLKLLAGERPSRFVCPAGIGPIEIDNVRLIAEWVEVRYSSLPAGTRLMKISDRDGRLTADLMPDLELQEAILNGGTLIEVR